MTNLRHILRQAILEQSAPSGGNGRLGPRTKSLEPAVALVHWSSHSLEAPQNCAALALELFKEVLAVCWFLFPILLGSKYSYLGVRVEI